MSKRPSIAAVKLDDEPLEEVAPAQVAAKPAVKARSPEPMPEPEPEPDPVLERRLHGSTIYMPVEAFEKLRFVAFTRRKSINRLVMEALDLMFQKEGYTERFTPKAEPKKKRGRV